MPPSPPPPPLPLRLLEIAPGSLQSPVLRPPPPLPVWKVSPPPSPAGRRLIVAVSEFASGDPAPPSFSPAPESGSGALAPPPPPHYNWPPSPSGPPGSLGAFTVSVTFDLRGDVVDFGNSAHAQIQAAIAAGTDVPLDAVTITIAAASVHVTARIEAATRAGADAISGELNRNLLASPDQLMAALHEQGLNSTLLRCNGWWCVQPEVHVISAAPTTAHRAASPATAVVWSIIGVCLAGALVYLRISRAARHNALFLCFFFRSRRQARLLATAGGCARDDGVCLNAPPPARVTFAEPSKGPTARKNKPTTGRGVRFSDMEGDDDEEEVDGDVDGNAGTDAEAPPAKGDDEWDEYTRVKLLGRGAAGAAYLMRRERDGHLCVCKVVRPDEVAAAGAEEQEEELSSEVNILAQLHHAHIVRFLASRQVGTRLHIYMEYATGGTLEKAVQTQARIRVSFTGRRVCTWVAQLADALEHMHEKVRTQVLESSPPSPPPPAA